jgi:hypothetical protein
MSRLALAAVVGVVAVLVSGCGLSKDPGDLAKIAVGPPPGGFPSSKPATPAQPGANGQVPALCTLNPPDEVLELLGIPGTGFADPALQKLALGKEQNNPNARVCVYITKGNLVRFSTLKGVTRADFDAAQQKLAADSARTGTTYDGELPGVADTARSAHAKDGEIMVFALAGDTKIQAGAHDVTAAKLGELVQRIATQLH